MTIRWLDQVMRQTEDDAWNLYASRQPEGRTEIATQLRYPNAEM